MGLGEECREETDSCLLVFEGLGQQNLTLVWELTIQTFRFKELCAMELGASHYLGINQLQHLRIKLETSYYPIPREKRQKTA